MDTQPLPASFKILPHLVFVSVFLYISGLMVVYLFLATANEFVAFISYFETCVKPNTYLTNTIIPKFFHWLWVFHTTVLEDGIGEVEVKEKWIPMFRILGAVLCAHAIYEYVKTILGVIAVLRELPVENRGGDQRADWDADGEPQELAHGEVNEWQLKGDGTE